MDFIGREAELEFLEQEYTRRSSYVALMGREGLGQTAILKTFERGKNSFHFSALIEIESQCLRRFARTLSQYTGEEFLRDRPLENWEDFFRAIAAYNPEEKKLVIVDNVQFLIEANTRFFHILRSVWDDFLKDCNLMLVTAGPYRTTTVQHYLKKGGIFQDGVVKSLPIRAFTFLDIAGHHPALTFSQLVQLYTYTGGVPKYLDMFGDGRNLMDCLETYVMNKSGYHHELPLQMLEKEVREPATYFSILNVIAEGNNKLHDIATALDLKTNALGPYLSLLVKLNLIERVVPVTESSPRRSRKGLYRISDHFLAFWFRFISPNWVKLEQGDTAYVRRALEEHAADSLIRPSYIKVCTEIFASLCRSGEIDLTPQRVGSFWNGDGIPLIDIIAVDPKGSRLFVADCYYLPEGEQVSIDAYAHITQRLARIDELQHFQQITYGFFTNRDFHPALRALAATDDRILLVRETARVRG